MKKNKKKIILYKKSKIKTLPRKIDRNFCGNIRGMRFSKAISSKAISKNKTASLYMTKKLLKDLLTLQKQNTLGRLFYQNNTRISKIYLKSVLERNTLQVLRKRTMNSLRKYNFPSLLKNSPLSQNIATRSKLRFARNNYSSLFFRHGKWRSILWPTSPSMIHKAWERVMTRVDLINKKQWYRKRPYYRKLKLALPKKKFYHSGSFKFKARKFFVSKDKKKSWIKRIYYWYTPYNDAIGATVPYLQGPEDKGYNYTSLQDYAAYYGLGGIARQPFGRASKQEKKFKEYRHWYWERRTKIYNKGKVVGRKPRQRPYKKKLPFFIRMDAQELLTRKLKLPAFKAYKPYWNLTKPKKQKRNKLKKQILRGKKRVLKSKKGNVRAPKSKSIKKSIKARKSNQKIKTTKSKKGIKHRKFNPKYNQPKIFEKGTKKFHVIRMLTFYRGRIKYFFSNFFNSTRLPKPSVVRRLLAQNEKSVRHEKKPDLTRKKVLRRIPAIFKTKTDTPRKRTTPINWIRRYKRRKSDKRRIRTNPKFAGFKLKNNTLIDIIARKFKDLKTTHRSKKINKKVFLNNFAKMRLYFKALRPSTSKKSTFLFKRFRKKNLRSKRFKLKQTKASIWTQYNKNKIYKKAIFKQIKKIKKNQLKKLALSKHKLTVQRVLLLPKRLKSFKKKPSLIWKGKKAILSIIFRKEFNQKYTGYKTKKKQKLAFLNDLKSEKLRLERFIKPKFVNEDKVDWLRWQEFLYEEKLKKQDLSTLKPKFLLKNFERYLLLQNKTQPLKKKIIKKSVKQLEKKPKKSVRLQSYYAFNRSRNLLLKKKSVKYLKNLKNIKHELASDKTKTHKLERLLRKSTRQYRKILMRFKKDKRIKNVNNTIRARIISINKKIGELNKKRIKNNKRIVRKEKVLTLLQSVVKKVKKTRLHNRFFRASKNIRNKDPKFLKKLKIRRKKLRLRKRFKFLQRLSQKNTVRNLLRMLTYTAENRANKKLFRTTRALLTKNADYRKKISQRYHSEENMAYASDNWRLNRKNKHLFFDNDKDDVNFVPKKLDLFRELLIDSLRKRKFATKTWEPYTKLAKLQEGLTSNLLSKWVYRRNSTLSRWKIARNRLRLFDLDETFDWYEDSSFVDDQIIKLPRWYSYFLSAQSAKKYSKIFSKVKNKISKKFTVSNFEKNTMLQFLKINNNTFRKLIFYKFLKMKKFLNSRSEGLNFKKGFIRIANATIQWELNRRRRRPNKYILSKRLKLKYNKKKANLNLSKKKQVFGYVASGAKLLSKKFSLLNMKQHYKLQKQTQIVNSLNYQLQKKYKMIGQKNGKVKKITLKHNKLLKKLVKKLYKFKDMSKTANSFPLWKGLIIKEPKYNTDILYNKWNLISLQQTPKLNYKMMPLKKYVAAGFNSQYKQGLPKALRITFNPSKWESRVMTKPIYRTLAKQKKNKLQTSEESFLKYVPTNIKTYYKQQTNVLRLKENDWFWNFNKTTKNIALIQQKIKKNISSKASNKNSITHITRVLQIINKFKTQLSITKGIYPTYINRFKYPTILGMKLTNNFKDSTNNWIAKKKLIRNFNLVNQKNRLNDLQQQVYKMGSKRLKNLNHNLEQLPRINNVNKMRNSIKLYSKLYERFKKEIDAPSKLMRPNNEIYKKTKLITFNNVLFKKDENCPFWVNQQVHLQKTRALSSFFKNNTKKYSKPLIIKQQLSPLYNKRFLNILKTSYFYKYAKITKSKLSRSHAMKIIDPEGAARVEADFIYDTLNENRMNKIIRTKNYNTYHVWPLIKPHWNPIYDIGLNVYAFKVWKPAYCKYPWLSPILFKKSLYFDSRDRRNLRYKNPRFYKRNQLYFFYQKLLFPFYGRMQFRKNSFKLKSVLSKIILPFYGELKKKQFLKIVKNIKRIKNHTLSRFSTLMDHLERRIDVVAYRMNFAPTIQWAREQVLSGFITINGVPVRQPWKLVPNNAIVQLNLNPVARRDLNSNFPQHLFQKPVPKNIILQDTLAAGVYLYAPEIKDTRFNDRIRPQFLNILRLAK